MHREEKAEPMTLTVPHYIWVGKRKNGGGDLPVGNRTATADGHDAVATRTAAVDPGSAHAIDGQPAETARGTICH